MKNDIVDVVSGYVKIQKKGSSYFGLCPFHNEKSPSFSVSPGKQMYYCFGCGAGGNVFSFVMQYENFTFPEAVKMLAERAGVNLPEVEYTEEMRRKEDRRSRLLEINKLAATYFFYQLRSERGKVGLEYLKKRQLSDETIRHWGLGFSNVTSNDLVKYLKSKGYDDQIIQEAGLASFDERYGLHDKFWNRVMFPIQDINHRVIGFGGRVMGDGKPKYLNSPETPIFDKSRNLYGLNFARTARTNNIILCEGYRDVISMHQAGFTQAVASLGTALTTGQAMLIKRYVKDVLICYDSDGPGVKAALRAIGIFREAGLRTRVINMQPHKDADEFIKAKGREAFQERIDNAENSFLFEVRMMERDYDINDPDGKTAFMGAVAKRLTDFEEEIERNNYLEAVAAKYFVSPDSLRKLVARSAATTAAGRERKSVNVTDRAKAKDDGVHKSQRMILTWICDDPDIYKAVRDYITPEDFTEPLYKELAGMMFAQLEEGRFNPAAILNRFEDDERQREAAMILNTNILDDSALESDREKALNEAVINIRRNSLEMRSRSAADLNELQKIIAEQAGLKNLHISLR